MQCASGLDFRAAIAFLYVINLKYFSDLLDPIITADDTNFVFSDNK